MATAKNEIATTTQPGALEAPKTEQLATSEKFTNKVLKEFGGSVAGALQVTDYQRTLIQGYFIVIDRALKAAEEERLRKNANNKDHKYDNDLPVNWNTVNLNDLALDLVHYARMGLDMTQDNMLFPMPKLSTTLGVNSLKTDLNLKQKKAVKNIKYCANDQWQFVNGWYDEKAEDCRQLMMNPKELFDRIYKESMENVYDEGFCGFGGGAASYLKDIRFCGKKFLQTVTFYYLAKLLEDSVPEVDGTEEDAERVATDLLALKAELGL